jgi:hypothetical protein
LFWIAFNKWVYHPFITHFFSIEPYTEYDFIRKKLSNLIITLVAAWIIGGFYEDIVFSGVYPDNNSRMVYQIETFILARGAFDKYFVWGYIIGNKGFLVLFLPLSAVCFGHFYYGATKEIYVSDYFTCSL